MLPYEILFLYKPEKLFLLTMYLCYKHPLLFTVHFIVKYMFVTFKLDNVDPNGWSKFEWKV